MVDTPVSNANYVGNLCNVQNQNASLLPCGTITYSVFISSVAMELKAHAIFERSVAAAKPIAAITSFP